jgi:hypothetical protein
LGFEVFLLLLLLGFFFWYWELNQSLLSILDKCSTSKPHPLSLKDLFNSLQSSLLDSTFDPLHSVLSSSHCDPYKT